MYLMVSLTPAFHYWPLLAAELPVPKQHLSQAPAGDGLPEVVSQAPVPRFWQLAAMAEEATLGLIPSLRELILRHAPPGSLFRRYLIHRLQITTRVGGLPIAIDTVLRSLQYGLHGLAVIILRQPEYLVAERIKYGRWFLGAYRLVQDLEAAGLKVLTAYETIKTQRAAELVRTQDLEHRALSSPPERERVRAGLERFLVEPADALPSEGRFTALQLLLMDRVFRDSVLSKMKIAVLGYGMNLDLVAFFLALGFPVAGIEKRGSGESWELAERPYPEDHYGLADAIGLPEWAEVPGDWAKFSQGEVHELLGHPPQLSLYDVSDGDLPWSTFDLVVAPAIVDEALVTATQLLRPGGHLLADAYHYKGIVSTESGALFAAAARKVLGIDFTVLFDMDFEKFARVLPTDFLGSHRVYLLQQNS